MRKYSLHWSLHPGKTKEWYEEEKGRRTEDAVARELDINYSLSLSGKVFVPFREERHVGSAFTWSPNLPVYRVWDWGKTNCVLYGQIDKYGRKRIWHERVLGAANAFSEEYSQPSNFTEQLRIARMDSEKLFPNAEFIDICDPAGSFDDQRGAATEVESLWEDAKIRAEYDKITALPTKDRKKRGIALILRDLQDTPGGQEAFRIYIPKEGTGGCPILKKAFQSGYCYKKDHAGNTLDVIRETHPYEDVIDCLIYFYLQGGDGVGAPGDSNPIEPYFNIPHFNPLTGF